MSAPPWLQWLRAVSRDRTSPGHFDKALLGAITGQDARALAAFDACWALYAGADKNGREASLRAARALIQAIQPQCATFARLLIARSLDWDDCAKIWSLLIDETITEIHQLIEARRGL